MNATEAANLFDVPGVTIATGVVRVMARGKARANADACMACGAWTDGSGPGRVAGAVVCSCPAGLARSIVAEWDAAKELA